MTKKSDHIQPVLYTLHWLPVHKRTEFKLLCLTFKVLNDIAPVYLNDLLNIRVPGRTLRSTTEGAFTLHQPIFKTNFYGSRAFINSAPRLWNKLPPELRYCHDYEVFKSRVKTYLF